MLMANTQEIASKRRSCFHDSTRVDGLLDNCCLKCGADGYWQNGDPVDPADAAGAPHPSGKTLLRLGLNNAG